MRIWSRIDLHAERRSYDLPIDGTLTTVFKDVVTDTKSDASHRLRTRTRTLTLTLTLTLSLTLSLTLTTHLSPYQDLRQFVAEKKETRRFDDLSLGEMAYKEITEVSIICTEPLIPYPYPYRYPYP